MNQSYQVVKKNNYENALKLFLLGIVLNVILLNGKITFVNEEILLGLRTAISVVIIPFIFYHLSNKSINYWLSMFLFYTIVEALILLSIHDFVLSTLLIRLITLTMLYLLFKNKKLDKN